MQYAKFLWVLGSLLCGSVWAGLPIQHWTQASGAQIFLIESPALPMVDVQLDWDAGGRRDPVDKPGLASLMAAATADGVQASGVLAALDENALSEAWADIGASFSAWASGDRLSFALRTLTDQSILEQAAVLAARQLGQPAFPESVWLRDRPKIIASIEDANTRPTTLAARAFARAVYGAHPYGYEMAADSLLTITTQDMRELHARALQACGAKVSVVGALNRAQADALVAQLLGRLPRGDCARRPAVPEVQPLAAPVEIAIPFSAAQAQVLMGQPGIKRNDPDYFALTLGNHILGGGGFTSRLMTQVREKRGLTYSVYSSFTPGLHAGAFTVSLQTRPDQAQAALHLVRQVVQDFVRTGPTQAELDAAKSNLVGGFALRIDSNKKLLDNLAVIAWNDLPLNYLDTWTQQMQGITARQIQEAFQRHLQPDRMVTVVLGGEMDGKSEK